MKKSFKLRLILATLACLIASSAITNTAYAADSIEKVPVYRFYHRKTSSHFYTTKTSERERVITQMSSIYRYEGAKFSGWKASGVNRVAVKRLYNFKTKTHFYTISPSEANRLVQSGKYRNEGTAYYGQSDYVDNDELETDWLGQCSLYRFYNFKNGTHFYTANPLEAYNVIEQMDNKYRFEGVAYLIWTDPCYE